MEYFHLLSITRAAIGNGNAKENHGQYEGFR